MWFQFSCCGVESYKDWDTYFKGQLPLSCCSVPNGIVGNFSCTVENEDTNRFKLGCLTEFSNFIEAHAVSLGAAGVVIAIIQVCLYCLNFFFFFLKYWI